jgi:hypothetical protein
MVTSRILARFAFHAVGDERDGWEPIAVEQFAAQIVN